MFAKKIYKKIIYEWKEKLGASMNKKFHDEPCY